MTLQAKERPIIFKGDMVRAILEGRKTQTRRLVPEWQLPGLTLDGDQYISIAQRHPRWGFGVFGKTEAECMANYNDEYASLCPYGKPGDRLWVRETFSASEFMDCRYRADGQQFLNVNGKDTNTPCEVKWTPSIHMPRWASRITLEITGVRVERLQDISEEDAIAEGAQHFPDLPGMSPYGQDCRWSMEQPESVYQCLGSPRWAFANYFCKLAGNAPKGIHDERPWDANPWVWVIEFRRVNG
jgi:hypothetical protein